MNNLFYLLESSIFMGGTYRVLSRAGTGITMGITVLMG